MRVGEIENKDERHSAMADAPERNKQGSLWARRERISRPSSGRRSGEEDQEEEESSISVSKFRLDCSNGMGQVHHRKARPLHSNLRHTKD